MFASNVERILTIINLAKIWKTSRLSGRSMWRMTDAAKKLGTLMQV